MSRTEPWAQNEMYLNCVVHLVRLATYGPQDPGSNPGVGISFCAVVHLRLEPLTEDTGKTCVAEKMDSTPHCSRVVPHPSTERAQTALTSVFG